jgi:hypothetical protein
MEISAARPKTSIGEFRISRAPTDKKLQRMALDLSLRFKKYATVSVEGRGSGHLSGNPPSDLAYVIWIQDVGYFHSPCWADIQDKYVSLMDLKEGDVPQ